jgi:hypothetical protein
MTDTTYIKALRAESANLMILLHKEELGVEVTLTTAKFFDDVFRLLEAERQRADKANRTCSDLLRTATDEAMRANKAEAELAALKGDQVPVGIFAGTDECSEVRHISWLSGASKLQAGDKLFTAPQKPVVCFGDIAIHENLPIVGSLVSYKDVVELIEAAGGIVKDGE